MKMLYVVALMCLAGCFSPSPDSTVKITNLAGNSGGSGTVVESTPVRSRVLTNAHVCGVVVNGGLVHSLNGRTAVVTAYQVSEVHDLCLITVQAALGEAKPLSSGSPTLFDHATVIGHPHLLPTIITTGHFSGRQMVTVMTGVKDCAEADLSDPQAAFLCALFGKLPIFRNYETVVVSALIQPGSSGSAVYAADGGIGAVIFAGRGDLSYGMAVPYEYIVNFLRLETQFLEVKHPNNTLSLKDAGLASFKLQLQTACRTKRNKLTDVCTKLRHSANVSDLIERLDY